MLPIRNAFLSLKCAYRFLLGNAILAFLFDMPGGFHHFLTAILMTVPTTYYAPAVCQAVMDVLHAQSTSGPSFTT